MSLALCLMTLLSLALAQTPGSELKRAIAASDLNAVKALLSAQPTMAKEKVIDGQSALWFTLKTTRNLPVAKALLDEGADPDEIVDGKPLLHLAAEAPSSQLVELLLAKGCNRKVTDAEGCSALNHAAVPGTLKILAEAGLDLSQPNRAGSTPLHSNSGRPDCVSYLIGRGVPLNSRDEWGRTPLYLATCTPPSAQLLVKAGAQLELADNFGNRPLHFACDHGHIETINLLLENGASPNSRDRDGETPLHHLVLGLRNKLQQGKWTSCGFDGKPRPMTSQESNDYQAVVRRMKSHGLDKNIKGKGGTALELIAQSENMADFALFLQKL